MAHKCKVILVGEAGVGKTCLIKQYLDRTFDPEEIPTIAGQEVFKEINVENENIKLTIWDTCGQERFRSINKIFMKESDIVILVYDKTNMKSFQELKNYWYDNVVSNIGNNFVIGIAGNKYDLLEEEKVHTHDGIKYAKSIGAIFKETSATSHDEIEQLFEELARKFVNKGNKNERDSIKINQDNSINPKKKCCF